MPRRFSSSIWGLFCLVPLLCHGFVSLPSSPLFRLTPSSTWLLSPTNTRPTTAPLAVRSPTFRKAPLLLSPPPISSFNILDAEVVSCNDSSTSTDAAVSSHQQVTSSGTKHTQNDAVVSSDDDPFGISYSQAIQRTLVYVAAACLFGLGIAWKSSIADAQEFFATYFLEQSLSVDNLLVFCSIFSLFEIPLQHQNKILNWGIFCAALFRVLMIGGGSMAFSHYPVAKLICGLFLLTTAGNGTLKTYLQHAESQEDNNSNSNNNNTQKKKEEDPNQLAKSLLSLTNIPTSLFPYTRELHGDQFMVQTPDQKGYVFTPMFLCLLAIEIADVLFAFDSVPAGLGVTRTPWILMTSNLFAILGLRSMFLIVSKVTADLEYMEIGLSAILAFLGSSMVVEYWGGYPPMDTTLSVGFVGTVLAATVGASLWKQQQEQQQEPAQTMA